jgi:hypothetical protein
MTSFRLVGLDPAPFDPLFALSDAQLEARGVRRVVADESPGYPCRVSLVDAEIGDELLLLSFEHLGGASPYRACGPVFVRRGARRAVLAAGEVSPYVTRRLISVRAYDRAHMMRSGEVCAGERVGDAIERLLGDDAVAYLHLHNAARGCFSCRVERAD